MNFFFEVSGWLLPPNTYALYHNRDGKQAARKQQLRKKQNPGEEADKREGTGKQQAANVLVVQCGMHLHKHTAVRHF